MNQPFQKRQPRRGFLKKALIGLVAFVPAVGALVAQNPRGILRASPAGAVDPAAQVPPPPPPPPPPGTLLFARKSVSGVVTGIGAAEINVRAGRGAGVVVVEPATKVWKGDYDWGLPIEVGDSIKARGELKEDSDSFRLDAETVWINIVNLIGPVSNPRSSPSGLEFTLHDRHGRAFSLEIDGRTLVNRPNTPEQTFRVNPVNLADGQVVQVIGLDLRNGSVLARRVFLG